MSLIDIDTMRCSPLTRPPAPQCFRTTRRRLNSTAAASSTPTAPSGIPYSSLTIGVPKEAFPNERRVAVTPQNASLLLKKGFSRVLVERHAGEEAQFLDEQYAQAGATLVSKEEVFASSDILLKVRPPLNEEVPRIKEGSTAISFLYPAQNKGVVDALAARKVNAFAVCCSLRLFP